MTSAGFDVLVVGAGPAGLAAAASAARSGARVGLIDDNPAPGGQIWRGASGPAERRVREIRRRGVILLAQTRVVAPIGPGLLLAESEGVARELNFGLLVLATGARERFLPFPGWTLPGVMGAGGLQALAKGGLQMAGKRIVVAGSGPLLVAVAAHVRAKGADVLLVAEQTPWAGLASFARALSRRPVKIMQAVGLGRMLRGVPLRAGCWVTQAHGDGRLEYVTLQGDGQSSTLATDYLACGYGLVPSTELATSFGCAIEAGAVRVDSWQQTSVERIYAAGEVTGISGVDAAMREGQIAGLVATGHSTEAQRIFAARERDRHFAAVLDRAFALRGELRALAASDTIVCRCEDIPFEALNGRASWREAKLHTRCGMGPCQGRICGAATQFLFGWSPDSVRPPITVARLGSLVRSDDLKRQAQESLE